MSRFTFVALFCTFLAHPTSLVAQPSAVIRVVGYEELNPVVSGMAPLAVHVDALSSSTGPGDWLDTRFTWDFGNPGAPFNRLPGWGGAHVYDQPGSYLLRLLVVDPEGQAATEVIRINVLPDTRERVYLSPSGSDDNDGSSPEQAIVSTARLNQLLTDDLAILFARGGQFSLADQQIRLENLRNILIGSYGEGSRPVLMGPPWSPEIALSLISIDTLPPSGWVENIVIEDLEFRTPSPASLDTEHNHNAISLMGKGIRNVTVRRCFYENVGYCHVAGQGAWPLDVCDYIFPEGFLLLHNRATRYSDYFIFSTANNTTLLGNSVSEGSMASWVTRFYADRVFLHGNDFRNPYGTIEEYALAGGTHCDTETGLNTCDCEPANGNLQWGQFAYLSNNTLDGTIRLGYEGRDSYYRWIVLENNRMLREAPNQAVTPTIRHYKYVDHVAIRGNLFAGPGGGGPNVFSGEGVSDIRILHNTGLDPSNANGLANIYASPDNPEAFRIQGNLWINPNYRPSVEPGFYHVFQAAANDLTGFRFNANAWPSSILPEWPAPFLVNGLGFIQQSQWLINGAVEADFFHELNFDALNSLHQPQASSLLTAGAPPIAGFPPDLYGRSRPSNGSWTIGALEPLSSPDIPAFSNMVIFGDSYSDTGRGGISTNNPPGRLWVDFLAGHLQLPEPLPFNGTIPSSAWNFAIGGASIGESGPQQLAEYRSARQNQPIPADTLHIVWIGGNDVLNQLLSPEDAANAVIELLENLIIEGARHILTGSQVPWGHMPAFTSSADLWNNYALSFNEHLRLGLTRLRHAFPQAHIIHFDAFALFRSFVANPSAYSFDNVTAPLFDHPEANPARWLWADTVHPTSAAHAQIALFALGQMQAYFASAKPLAFPVLPFNLQILQANSTSLHLRLRAETGASGRLEQSTDLQRWSLLQNLSDLDPESHWQFADSDLHPPLFIRAVRQTPQP